MTHTLTSLFPRSGFGPSAKRAAAALLLVAVSGGFAPAGFAQTLPPDTLTNTLFHGTVTQASGSLPSSGTFSQLFTADTDYNIALEDLPPATPVPYEYEILNDTTARITEPGVTVDLTFADADSGTFVATVATLGSQSGTFTLEPLGTGDGNPALLNISTRTFISDGGLAIAGFIIGGAEERRVLIRVIGPTLTALGVADVVNDPVLTVFSGDVPIAANDNWAATPENRDAVAAAIAGTTAFPLDEGTMDAATVVTLPPGPYTVFVEAAAAGDPGEVLAEVYFVE